MASVTRAASATAGDHSTAVDHTYTNKGADADWSSLGNMAASDNTRTISTLTAGPCQTYRLDVKNWGFSIPTGATIDGIEANIEWSSGNSGVAESQVRLLKASTPSGTNKAANSATTTDSTDTHGGAADLWGNTLSDTDVNSSGFGIALQYAWDVTSSVNARIDQVQITVYYTEGGGTTLTPSLYSDGDTFFSPTVAAGAVTLTPALYSDGDTFHAPTVAPGAVDLAPDPYSDADAFHAPTVALDGGPQTLTPALFSDGDTFHAPTVAPGAVSLAPAVYADADAFHAAEVAAGYNLAPAAFADGDTFHAATVAPGAVSLAPALYSDSDAFHAPTVALAGGVQTLTPALFADVDSFYAATVDGVDMTTDLITAAARDTLQTASARTTLATAPSRTFLIESRHAIHG